MGAEESIPLPPPPPGFEYMVMFMTGYDKIRVNFGSQQELSIIRQAIQQQWLQGLQSEKVKCGYSITFKLNGMPFGVGSTSQAAASARQMIGQILLNLNSAGWHLLTCSDLGRVFDLSTFYFARKAVPSIQHPLLCIGFSAFDKLQIINAPANIIEVIKRVIQTTWRRGIQNEEQKGIYYEFKLKGNPWMSTGDESVQARLLVNNILTALAQNQLVLHGNCNIKSTADTLYFRYDPNVVPGEANAHFVISLNRNDRLRMINAPQALIQTVQQVITQFWSGMGGIQKERQYFESWEFKLSGTPWWSTGDEAVMARFLACKLLEGLQTQGWHVKAAIDMCRKQNDKSVLVFYQSLPRNAPVVCLSFNDVDKIRLINAPEEFIGLCKGIIEAKWCKGIKEEKRLQTPCMAYQFKLFGNPWSGYYVVDGLHIRSMLCYIIQMLSQRGWKLLISADVSAKYVHRDKAPDYPLDVHSWWFTYDAEGHEQPAATTYGFTPTQFTTPANPPTDMGYSAPPSYNQVMQETHGQ